MPTTSCRLVFTFCLPREFRLSCRSVEFSPALAQTGSLSFQGFQNGVSALSFPWISLETDLLPSPEGAPSGHVCHQETLEKEVHLEKCLSELIGDLQLQVGGNQTLAPSPRGPSFNSQRGASDPRLRRRLEFYFGIVSWGKNNYHNHKKSTVIQISSFPSGCFPQCLPILKSDESSRVWNPCSLLSVCLL